MARKVFLSMLGTGLYKKCKYTTNSFCSSESRFIQKATLESIGAVNWTENDTVIILLTEKARELNWDLLERKSQNETLKYRGLKYILSDLNLPCKVQDVSIPEGGNEEEMWEIFSIIFNHIENDDELYIDLTHSFRYLPMLLLVLSNYSKFLKHTKVKHLTYGNYEGRDINKNEAPIINLLPIAALQDWTFAAADYLKNGNIEHLEQLSTNVLRPILKATKGADKSAALMRELVNRLKDVTEEFQTCRGLNIINATNIKVVKNCLSEIEKTVIEPFNPILKKINNTFEEFDSDKNIKNGLQAANWCFTNGLYQQSATILQETVVSLFCQRNGIDYTLESERESVNNAFFIKIYDTPESKWNVKEANIGHVKQILNDPLLINREILDSFGRLTELRNDINHSGMRSSQSPFTTKQIKDKLEKELTLLYTEFCLNL